MENEIHSLVEVIKTTQKDVDTAKERKDSFQEMRNHKFAEIARLRSEMEHLDNVLLPEADEQYNHAVAAVEGMKRNLKIALDKETEQKMSDLLNGIV